jgi:GT2 family glycosyltransferase
MDKVDVVIPIYNNLFELRLLLDSLESEIGSIHRLILVDDSSDSQTKLFLESFAKIRPHVVLLKNDINIGFTGSANRGLRISTRDTLLINTDVIFPKGGIDLLHKELNRSRVASVTALCDAPGTYATTSLIDSQIYPILRRFPFMRSAIELKSVEDVNKYNSIWRFIARLSLNRKQYVPSCVGFCVMLKVNALEIVGYFDESKFNIGYGEENDWSFRAARNDFKHILSNLVIVHHTVGGSFKSRTNELSAIHARRLIEMYSEYPECFNQFKFSSSKFIKVFLTNAIHKLLN